ncbi:MAG: septum formation protein Maf [Acidobacteria bacterium]|nr:septum formation protein Maf [Acidobacteriota bacterium]
MDSSTPPSARPPILLASASPRRAQLLSAAGIRFEVQPARVDETPRDDETPAAYVVRLALDKAGAVARTHPGRLVLGADTTVVVAGCMLGKAADAVEARRMLAELSGRAHEVLTGVALVGPSDPVTAVSASTVWFQELTSEDSEDIERYLATDEWRDKAGAYALQSWISRFVTRLEGSYTNVVGLPVALVCDLLMRYPEG